MTSASPFDKQFVREQKRAAILSEAAALFNIHGARATRLSDVADRLDLNQSSLYYYVASKDELIYQTYLESCDTIETMLDEAERAGRTGAERIAAFVRAYFRAWQAIANGERPHFAILTEIRGLKPAHREAVAGRYLAMFGRVRDFVEAGRQDGSLRADHALDTALAVFGLVQMTVLWVGKLKAEEYDAAAEAFNDILFNGVAAEPDAVDRLGEAERVPASLAPMLAAPEAKPEAFCIIGSDSFNRKGFRGTSLDEIAKRLAVSKGSFYHHVRDKDDLLRQCFQRSLDLFGRAQARAVKRAGCGLRKLWACTIELFAVQNSDAGPLIRFNLIPSLAPRYQESLREGLARVSDAFGRMIRDGVRDGSVRDVHPLVAEQMLLTAIDISADLRRIRPVEAVSEAYRSFFAFYFTGIAGDEPQSGR